MNKKSFLSIIVLIFALSACVGMQDEARPTLEAPGPDAASPPPTVTYNSPPGRGIIRPTAQFTDAPSPSPSLIPPSPTLTPAPPAWQVVAPGASEAFIPITDQGQVTYYAYALRLDPARVTFTVHYDRETPGTVEEWLQRTGAAAVINGSFFSGMNTPVGRLIIDGELFGYALQYEEDSIGIPGLFAVIDNRPGIYALGHSAYNPRGLQFDHAMECYPMLLLPGGQPAYPTETGKEARRTVIGIDQENQVIVLLVDAPIFSLYELANWLAASGLQLDLALNLDGGRSSGLAARFGDETRVYPAYVSLPIVLGIYTYDRND